MDTHLQACSEMVMPMCSDGVHDMFMNNSWNMAAYEEDCMKLFGVKPDPYRVESIYGGRDINAHSNIIFRYRVKLPIMLTDSSPCNRK